MKNSESNSFQSLRSVRVRDITLPFASLLLSGETPMQKQARSLVQDQAFAALLSMEMPIHGYASAADFAKDYLASELLSKFPFEGLGWDRREVALSKFHASEDQCRDTNKRLASSRNFDWMTTSVLMTARRKIANLLGPFNWDEAVLGFGFGPGSTTRLARRQADLYYKLSGQPHSTPENLVAAHAVLKYFNTWGSSCSSPELATDSLVVGNKVITVPKNAKTDRIIAKEPCLNIFVQKGIGAMIRRRLKRVGVDLDDQSLNQRLALIGSADGSLATIDLSAASDTVSIGIVELLLPSEWYDAMNSCRSHKGVLPSGETIVYRKFSSMGNGFTFELESLIFWALSVSVRHYVGESDRRLAVYGDDIIVPTSLVETLGSVLSFSGFSLNAKKTHVAGHFRESCGKHYFRGDDVTPIYIREKIDTVMRCFWAANAVKRRARMCWGHDSFFKPAWRLAYEAVPSKLRCKIPEGVGDGGFVVDFDEALPRRAKSGHCGYQVRHVVFVPRKTTHEDNPYLLKSLYRLRGGSRPFAHSIGTGVDPKAVRHLYNVGLPVGNSSPDGLAQRPSSVRGVFDVGRIEGGERFNRSYAFGTPHTSTDLLRAFDGSDLTNEVVHQDGSFRIVRSVVWQWESYGPWLG